MMWLLVIIGLPLIYPFFKWLIYVGAAIALLIPLVLVDIYEAFMGTIGKYR